MAIQLAMRYFNSEFNGRHLIVFSDHLPIIGSMKSNDHQCHDPQALNALNEISQWTSDVRHKSGKSIPVADWLSRPEGRIPSAYDVQPESELSSIAATTQSGVETVGCTPQSGVESVGYISPEETIAALENIALQTLNPVSLAADQITDEDVIAHKAGHKPKNVIVDTVRMSGVDIFCEVSDPNNPRPLAPAKQRSLVINLLHHGDHPGEKETVRRVASSYYWPKLRANVKGFVRTCHPCQVAKQSRTVGSKVLDCLATWRLALETFQSLTRDVRAFMSTSLAHCQRAMAINIF